MRVLGPDHFGMGRPCLCIVGRWRVFLSNYATLFPDNTICYNNLGYGVLVPLSEGRDLPLKFFTDHSWYVTKPNLVALATTAGG